MSESIVLYLLRMTEESENWWETTSEEGKKGDTEPPEPIPIRGYQREGEQWVQKTKEEGDRQSEGNISEWSDYSMQKAAVTGVFLFTFLVGDWRWDGSNGFGALFQMPSAISYWPEIYSWALEFHPIPATVIISQVLWDITPAVFLFMFLFGSNIIYAANLNDLKEDSPETRRIGKKANRNLKYFVFALILMDFIAFAASDSFSINAFVEYPTWFFEVRPGIHWMLVAFAASFGLNPENELYQRS